MPDGRTIYFFVNGIATWPGDARNWNKRAVTWMHLHTPHAAQNDEYFTTALTVWIHARRRAREFATLLRQFSGTQHKCCGYKIVIVAHSNGAAVALAALKLAHWPRVEALHLVSGACDGNFERTGLNGALHCSKVGQVVVYIAGRDVAMRAEDTLAGKALFGIYAGDRPLGLAGPQKLAPDLKGTERVVTLTESKFGHSSWWAAKHFDETMRRFVA